MEKIDSHRPNDTTRQSEHAEMLAYRKKHFAVETRPSDHPIEEGEISLSVTTNGYQWSTLSFLKSEVSAVIEVLRLSQGVDANIAKLKPK